MMAFELSSQSIQHKQDSKNSEKHQQTKETPIKKDP